MPDSAAVHAKAALLGQHVLRMTTAAGSGHPSSGLSLAHVTVELMYHRMRFDPADPWNPRADRLVLSEGHAVPIIYAAYADLGGVVGRSKAEARPLTFDDLLTLRRRDSVLDGHPNPAEGFPFFDAATGSLGQGLSVAAGLALAARLDCVDKRIYVLLGDGESREGQVWEAMDFIVDHGLANVCAVFSANGQGQAGDVSPRQSPEALAAKAAAFGWRVRSIDGHDPVQIAAALDDVGRTDGPVAIVARTIKGWGVDSLQAGNWHGKPLPENLLEKGIAELEATARALGASVAAATWRRDGAMPPSSSGRPSGGGAVAEGSPAGSRCHTQGPGIHAGRTAAGSQCHTQTPVENRCHTPSPGIHAGRTPAGSQCHTQTPVENRCHTDLKLPPFTEAMEAAGLSADVAKQRVATRVAYGAALVAAGHLDDRVVSIDGDVSNSTYANMFARAHPARFFEGKIAEQNIISVAVGLAAAGKKPFASSFAKFLARGYDQVEMASITRADVKLVGSHAGVSLAADGPSQMSLHDVAYFRSMTRVKAAEDQPACLVFHPADPVCAYACVELMINHVGLCYLRTHRPAAPFLYALDEAFSMGACKQLRQGSKLTLVSSGFLLHTVLAAADELAGDGVDCNVFDAWCFPLDAGPILQAAAGAGGVILTVEDNYAGGLHAELAEA
ncbi:MAG: hypothetical protein C4547_13020, partial [Phycisphaerales bacterium]